jgi:TolB-like protein
VQDSVNLGLGPEDAPSRRAGSQVCFAGLVLDLDARMLARDTGDAITLTRGEFALLRAFVARPGRVLSRDTLLDAVAKRTLEPFDRSIDVLVGRLRKKIEADPRRPRLVVTVPGEGYRFDGLAPSLSYEQKATSRAKIPLSEPREPSRLSLVVLPFANIGGNPNQEHFVDGLTESLTTDLSRIRGAVVIARNTAFAYKGTRVDVKTTGRELNVRYVLEGSVQRGGTRMRVNVQLIDAETANHLWAERFDKPLGDLFNMQDEIVARLAGALNAELVAVEARRAEQALTPDSMDLYFQGLAWLNKGLTPGHIAQARSLFDRALAADPDNVDALVGSAVADVREGANSFVTDPRSAFSAAEAKLIKALSSVPDHARGHMWLGLADVWTKRAAQGIAECEHALHLDRNLAHAQSIIGRGRVFVGRAEETEAHVAEALRLSPRDTMANIWMYFAGLANLHLGKYQEAVSWFCRALEANRNYPAANFNLAAALAQLGRMEEADSAVRAGLALNPTFTVSRARATLTARSDDPTYLTQLEPIFDGLRKAGVPKG